MLKITQPGPNRVDLELEGALNAEEMREGLDTLLRASQPVKDGVMLYRIRDFAMPTFGALTVEFQRLPALFGLIGKFRRCAVLSDQAWLRTAAEIEGALIPGLAIKAFAYDEDAAAERWLAEG